MKIFVDEHIPAITVRTLAFMGHEIRDIRGTPDEGVQNDALWEMVQREKRLLIRESLSYLVFGDGDAIERMANLIFHPDYKLEQFGQANVQELVGWCSEEYPVINGRTTKILRFFGFDVRQLS